LGRSIYGKSLPPAFGQPNALSGTAYNHADQSQFHCHNLIHEDHEMMAAMNVTALSDLGYDEKTSFIDPMEQRYRAKAFANGDFTGRSGDFSAAAIQEKVGFFNGLDAYRNVKGVESRLEEYWNTASSGGSSSATSSSVVSGTTLATSASASASVSSAASSAAASSSTPSATSSGTPSSTTSVAATPTVSVTTTAKASTTSTKKADDKSTKKTSTSSTKK
jgi:bilirubin oxidase